MKQAIENEIKDLRRRLRILPDSAPHRAKLVRELAELKRLNAPTAPERGLACPVGRGKPRKQSRGDKGIDPLRGHYRADHDVG
jgi:hypothetical protein